MALLPRRYRERIVVRLLATVVPILKKERHEAPMLQIGTEQSLENAETAHCYKMKQEGRMSRKAGKDCQ